MNPILRALRPLTLSAHLLCALFLFILAAPMCAAAGSAPIISASVSPATLPVTGGVIAFTATVTSPTGQAITNVYADWTAGGGYYGRVTLSNGGSGSIYSGTIHTNGNNTSLAPYVFNATVTATDALNASSAATATGQTTQSNDATPPTITSTSITPSALPVSGGVVTIQATITDPNNCPITNVYADWTAGGGYYGRVTLSSGNSSNIYSGSFHTNGNNTTSAAYIFTSVITAVNDLSLSNSATVAGQTVQEDSLGTVPPLTAGLTHIMWTNADGRLSLWNYDPLAGGFSQITYGPYAGWAAKAVADGPDGKTRVLWDKSDGTMSLWDLDNTTGIFTQNSFGPYAGWTATGLSVGP